MSMFGRTPKFHELVFKKVSQSAPVIIEPLTNGTARLFELFRRLKRRESGKRFTSVDAVTSQEKFTVKFISRKTLAKIMYKSRIGEE